MKKIILLLVFLSICPTLFAQIEQHEVTVINIAVPVRVFDGNRFVDNLKIEDFELFENGILQKIEALYFLDKSRVTRAEEFKTFTPPVSRHFFLLFQMTEYNPKLAEAFDYFFEEVILPEDQLTIMTPMKNYSLPKGALKTYSRKQLSKEMQAIVRKDTKIGSSQYQSLMRDLQRLIRAISGAGFMSGSEGGSMDSASLEFMLPRYREALLDLENLRVVNQKWFLLFAQQLKRIEGQKNVFFFYQREFRPEISPRILNQLEAEYQDQPNILGQIYELFQFYQRYATLDADLIKQAFSDSSLYFYFIFLNREPEKVFGINMREQSEDVFSTFKEVTRATGGLVDPTQNPAAGFKNAVAAAERCYLLYYSPKDYVKNDKFKNIVVKLKNRNYEVKYREGYFAN